MGAVTPLAADRNILVASSGRPLDDVMAAAGRINLLVNNAGLGLLGGAEESSMARLTRCST